MTDSKRATIKDVARRSGVGVGTVSRVVSGNGYVSEHTRVRVAAAIAALDYKPDLFARGLRNRSSGTIGIIVPDIANPLFAEILSSAERMLQEQQFLSLLTSSFYNEQAEVELFRNLSARHIDGIIVAPCSEDNAELSELLMAWQKPVVVLDRHFLDGQSHVGHVNIDHARGMQTAVNALAASGHRRAHLVYHGGTRPGMAREQAFRKAILTARGLSGTSSSGPGDAGFGYTATAAVLDGDTRPDAIIVGHNRMLSGALRALTERDIGIGRDLSLICCDRTELTDFYAPEIAVIRRDSERVGAAVCQLLMTLKQGGRAPERVVETQYAPAPSVRAMRR